MKKITLLNIFLYLFIPAALSQTVTDSIKIMSQLWETTSYYSGITCKSANFSQLYGGPQSISIIEIEPKQKHRTGIKALSTMQPISEMAKEANALAAINGSYFNMKTGESVCFLMLDKTVIDTTSRQEFQMRVNGAVKIKKGKMDIIPWNVDIEKSFNDKKSNILASGPLLLEKGKTCKWEKLNKNFIESKHPRSAIAKTKDGHILMITVDGRSKLHACGITIPELAHLIKVLGGYDALNLDGGGSTTIWCSGKILNHPSDNGKYDHQGERDIPNIIYVY